MISCRSTSARSSQRICIAGLLANSGLELRHYLIVRPDGAVAFSVLSQRFGDRFKLPRLLLHVASNSLLDDPRLRAVERRGKPNEPRGKSIAQPNRGNPRHCTISCSEE